MRTFIGFLPFFKCKQQSMHPRGGARAKDNALKREKNVYSKMFG